MIANTLNKVLGKLNAQFFESIVPDNKIKVIRKGRCNERQKYIKIFINKEYCNVFEKKVQRYRVVFTTKILLRGSIKGSVQAFRISLIDGSDIILSSFKSDRCNYSWRCLWGSTQSINISRNTQKTYTDLAD